MKAHQPIICALSLLTLATPVPAEQPEQSAKTTPAPNPLSTKISTYGYYSATPGSELRINFSVPMLKPEQVGSPVEPGYFTTNYPDYYTAKWLSTSCIGIEITKQMPILEVLRVEVPANLRGLNGEVLPGKIELLPTYQDDFVCIGSCQNESIFLRAESPKTVSALRERLSELYYTTDDTASAERYPLVCRPATVADALNNWYAFDAVNNYELDSHDQDELSTHPADEIIPDTWLVEAPGIPKGNQEVHMYLPRAEWDYHKKAMGDKKLYSYSAPGYYMFLSNTCPMRGKYEIQLELGMPAVAADASELVSSLNWKMLEEAHSNEWKPLEWKDGALRGRIRGKDITITPGEVVTDTLHIIGQGEVQGIRSITLNAETGGREILLEATGRYATISKPSGTDVETETLNDCTHLRPKAPFIYTDISANNMQLRGTTTLNCRYGQLISGTARVWKLNAATPAEKIRVMRDYGRLYTAQDYSTWEEWDERRKIRKAEKLDDNKLEHNRVDTSTLPGVVATVERPLSEGAENELSLPLAEIFPNEPVGGFYFVNIEGTPIKNSKTPVVNQGLIQVTDLGLMWKTNGSRLFAWAYKLSNAQELATATLHLLDEQGNQLAELPVTNGLAEGDFPPATRYLMLSTADDCVLLPHYAGDIDFGAIESNGWEIMEMMQRGIAPAEVPKPLVFLFSDRSLYRPGETAHAKGMVRWLDKNELKTPDIVSITARLLKDYQEVAKLPPATVQENGAFTLDIPLEQVGDYSVEFTITYRGDDDNTSPDLAILRATPPQQDKQQTAENNAEEEEETETLEPLAAPRTASLELVCREFRRNEFEVESTLTTNPAERKLEINATATNLTTTPVANGKVRWDISVANRNFYPKQEQWSDFRFGDFRESPWEFFYARYQNSYRSSSRDHMSREGTLDDAGRGNATFTLAKQDFPRLQHIVATTTVTNGNEQSIRSVQKTPLHPADVYAGIRPHATLAKVGGTLPVDLVAVSPDGNGWNGAPINATVTATCTVFHPYRYGSRFSSSVHNSEQNETTHTITTTLTGTPTTVQVPVDKAGRYDITVSGTDAQGRPFRSATRHYVWGGEVSPWEHLDHYGLELVPDKELYHAGETAKILVQTPVDAELLITVERDKVLRHYRRSVTVDNPVIEIPIEAADAPIVYLGAFLVQNEEQREGDGKPQIKLGTCQLRIDTPDKKLTVQLQTPPHSLQPGESCTVTGRITDAAGNPVPNADITLYAEDEGTLQVTGYTLPNPGSYFYSEIGRMHSVGTYSGLGRLVSESMKHRDFGNKGIFIGGGDAEYEEETAEDSNETERLRTNFNPCALWLATVRTDDKGNFSATYNNPDTLTRYRLMAVAATGDCFGSGQSSYVVNKSIMLEPIVPMSATEGDELLLPVTVSMLPDALPGISPEQPIEWLVKLSGTNVELPQTTQSVTLTGKRPVTLHFPVKIPQGNGPVQLQWQVQAAAAPQGSALNRMRDAVELSFNTTPPTPHLREYVWAELQGGKSATLSQWLKNPYRDGGNVQLSLSTSPLSGLGYPLQYLFTYPYGCTEQLSSTVLPWLLKKPLEQALGVQFPTEHDPDAIAAEVDARLKKRRIAPGCYGYWDSSTETSEFSAYAIMVRYFISKQDKNELMEDVKALYQQTLDGKENVYLNLLVLNILLDDSKEIFNAVYERSQPLLSKLNSQQKWILAIAASAAKHPDAAKLLAEAQNSTESIFSTQYALPPVDALKALYATETEPNSPATADMLRQWLQQSNGSYSTWRNAWLTLIVSEYASSHDLAGKLARVNGTDVTAANPMHCKLTTGTPDSFSVIGNTVYVSGYAEGYLKTAQPEQAIDCGFSVQRRYEQLQPDGSWKATGSFRVGDIVRVTVNATANKNATNLRYIVIEDRLPATFEAVDPALTSQALPSGISEQTYRSWWYFPGTISNREFLKDRVRAFANNLWGNPKLEFSYVARVVRSGKVTAPAAKAELMYRPEFHGLSIPQHFEVSPRPQN